MLTLYHFGPVWGLPDASPFCVKLETYLRMTKIPFQTKRISNPRSAPKGKVPFIQDGDVKMGDSRLIIDYLKQKYGDPLDQYLTPMQRAEGLAFQCLLEEHLYWIMVYSRWFEPKAWEIVKQTFFAKLPGMLKWFIPGQVQKKMKQDLYAQGVGRHTPDELYSMGKQTLSAVSVFLGDKPYFLGDVPTSIDATVYGFLINLIDCPIDSVLKDHCQTLVNLKSYCERMKAAYF